MGDIVVGRWRLAEGMSLTHMESGGWTIADLHRLAVYEMDEGAGVLLEQFLESDASPADSTVLREALASGVLVETGGGAPRTVPPAQTNDESKEAY